MTKFSDMQKTNKFIIVFMAVYIITLTFVLMFLSKDISTELLLGGFGSAGTIFGVVVGFIKYQGRKKK